MHSKAILPITTKGNYHFQSVNNNFIIVFEQDWHWSLIDISHVQGYPFKKQLDCIYNNIMNRYHKNTLTFQGVLCCYVLFLILLQKIFIPVQVQSDCFIVRFDKWYTHTSVL